MRSISALVNTFATIYTFAASVCQRLELAYVQRCGVRMDAGCFFGTFGTMFGKRRSGR